MAVSPSGTKVTVSLSLEHWTRKILIRQAGIPSEKGFLIWDSWVKFNEYMTLHGGKKSIIFILLSTNWNSAFPSIMITGNNYDSMNTPVILSPTEINIFISYYGCCISKLHFCSYLLWKNIVLLDIPILLFIIIVFQQLVPFVLPWTFSFIWHYSENLKAFMIQKR